MAGVFVVHVKFVLLLPAANDIPQKTYSPSADSNNALGERAIWNIPAPLPPSNTLLKLVADANLLETAIENTPQPPSNI